MGFLGKSYSCIGCGKTFKGLLPWTKYRFTNEPEDKNVCFCSECKGILPVDPEAHLEKVPWRIVQEYFADCQRRLSKYAEFQVTYKQKNFRMDEEHGLFQLGANGKIFHVSELDGYMFVFSTRGKGEYGDLVFSYRAEGERYFNKEEKEGDILHFEVNSLTSTDETEERISILFDEKIITHHYSEPPCVQSLRWRFDAMCAYFGVPIDENGSGVEQIIFECMDYYLCNDKRVVSPKTVDLACKRVKEEFKSKNVLRYAQEIESVYQSVLNISAVKGEYERRKMEQLL